MGLLLGAVALRWWGAFEAADTWRQDLYAVHLLPPPARAGVMIVDLDDDVEPWPWHRGTLARLLEQLLNAGRARGAMVDVVLSERSSEAVETLRTGNAQLVAAARRSGKPVVLASAERIYPGADLEHLYRLGPGEALSPELRELPTGYATLLAPGEQGGPVRRVALTALPEGPDAPPVAFALSAMAVSGSSPPLVEPVTRRLRLGASWVWADPWFSVELPVVAEEFPDVIRASEVLEHTPMPEAVAQRIEGKLVVLGRHSDRLMDRVATPWGYRSGVAVQATLASQLLQGGCRHRWGVTLDLILQLAGFLVFVLLSRRRSPWRRFLLALEMLAGAVLIEVTVLLALSLWIDMPVVELALLGLLSLGSLWSGQPGKVPGLGTY